MKLSLAPMLKVTTAHYRRLLRIISKDVELFTEMLTADFILRNNHFWKRIGTYDANTTIQIGGCDPEKVARAVEKIVKASEFRKFNLNVGCPSNKVTKGEFGASLMLRKNVVIDIINSVFDKTGVVISVKCRIGVDHHDSFDFFENFIRSVSEQTKCRVFYVHARKCWLSGLSPKENRTKPPINYQFVKDVKKLYPWLEIHLNGEVKSIKDADGLDGIMIGREAMKNMFVFEELLHTGKIWSKCGHNEQFKSNSHILNGHETEDESSDDQNLTDSIALMEISESKHTEKIKLKDHEAINFNQQTKNISETTGGFISETTGGLISETTGGLISEVTGGLISETTGGLISEVTGGLISETTGGLISETTDKPISKTTGGLVSETTGGLISEVTGGLISETTDKPISKTTGELISEVTGGLISETTDKPISKTTGGLVSETTGGLISEVTGGLISETTDKPISKTTGGLVSETTGGLISEVTGKPISKTTENFTRKIILDIPHIFDILTEYLLSFDEDTILTHSDIIPTMQLFRNMPCNKIIKQILNEAACSRKSTGSQVVDKLRQLLRKKGYITE